MITIIIISLAIVIYFLFRDRFNVEGFDGGECQQCQYPMNWTTISCPHTFLSKKVKPKISSSNGKKETCLNCGYMRPGLYLPGYDGDCCDKKCSQSENENSRGRPYYCKLYGRCYKRYQKPGEEKWCGYGTMDGLPVKTYDDSESCVADINPYENLPRAQCLTTEGAGWCSDYMGHGSCVPGVPGRPIDILKFNYCYPNQRGERNSYVYGDKSWANI